MVAAFLAVPDSANFKPMLVAENRRPRPCPSAKPTRPHTSFGSRTAEVQINDINFDLRYSFTRFNLALVGSSHRLLPLPKLACR